MNAAVWPLKWVRPRRCAHQMREVERVNGEPVYRCLRCGAHSIPPEAQR